MYQTLLVNQTSGILTATLNRPEKKNSINNAMLDDIHAMLDVAEADPSIRLVVIKGRDGFFCTGMDFEEESAENTGHSRSGNSNRYMETLRRFTLSPKIIVAQVEGTAMAGGIGLVTCADLVIATPASQFSLSEALWGLLPACVTPYLIRRIGWQRAYHMTLTTLPISGQAALEAHLVDELTEKPEQNLRRLWLRLKRLDERTIADLKAYFRKMWIIDDQMEGNAVAEIARLRNDPRVHANIQNFVNHGRFPWD